MHEKSLVSTVDLVGYLMQTVMPSESYVRVKPLDALEMPMKLAKTYEWHYKLRVPRETLKTEPMPARLWHSVTSLLSHLVSQSPDFAVEWTSILRSVGMREGPTMKS
jgi:hypothetical protein